MGMHLRTDGTVDTSKFKIVYVAPMKALVAEMVGNFSKRLESFGIQVHSACLMHLPTGSSSPITATHVVVGSSSLGCC
jgi:pre-mRNA-splicing helicase BRR2